MRRPQWCQPSHGTRVRLTSIGQQWRAAGNCSFAVSSLLGDAAISRFRLTANINSFRLRTMTYDLTTDIPERSTPGLIAAGFLCLAALRRPRRD